MKYETLWRRLTGIYDTDEAKAIVRLVLDDRFGLSLTDIVCGKVEELSPTACETLEAMMCRLEQGEPVQYVFYGLIALSALGIFFLNSPNAYKKDSALGKALGVGSNLGAGLWATYGMSTGLLGDLLSYIRLFALGLTGGVLGSVFNQLAMEMSPDVPVVRELVMIIILLFGHGINFGLCMISSFVHPMRLTFVEYFKNADFEGNGKEYQPFQVKA